MAQDSWWKQLPWLHWLHRFTGPFTDCLWPPDPMACEDDMIVCLSEKVMKNMDISAKIRFDLPTISDGQSGKQIVTASIRQMDFGITRPCSTNCLDSESPCSPCDRVTAFIRKLIIRFTPKLPEGFTIDNVEGEPLNRPLPVMQQSGTTLSMQVGMNQWWQTGFQNMWNRTVQRVTFGWEPASVASAANAVTFIWKLGFWKTGQKLKVGAVGFGKHKLPINPRREQVHPKAFSDEPVRGIWHVSGNRRLQAKDVEFDACLEAHVYVWYKSRGFISNGKSHQVTTRLKMIKSREYSDNPNQES